MVRSAPVTVLTALGFSAELDRTYQLLRPQSGRSLDRVAGAMLRTPDELLAELEPLVAAGVIRVVDSVVEVAPPVEALRIMIAAQSVRAERSHRELDAITTAITKLADDERRGTPAHLETSQPIEGEVATGGDIYAMIRSLVLRGSGELLWLRPDQWVDPLEARMAALVAAAVAQGRGSRAIYPVRALHEAPEMLAARVAAGEVIRVIPDLPSRLLVIGDSHAVVPEPLGFANVPLSVVRQRGLVQAMTTWFELLWERAETPALDPVGPPSDLRRFLLEQLAAGVQDETIARTLGISLRTVRRRVAGLMSDLGADSRFQAGVEAVRRGWL